MNDPRITSYALGELTGAERDAFEKELAASEALQRELNETISLADALGKLPMPTETFTEEERSALREKCAENLKVRPRKFPIGRVLIATGTLAAAACLMIFLSRPAITGALVRGDSKDFAQLAEYKQSEQSAAASALAPGAVPVVDDARQVPEAHSLATSAPANEEKIAQLESAPASRGLDESRLPSAEALADAAAKTATLASANYASGNMAGAQPSEATLDAKNELFAASKEDSKREGGASTELEKTKISSGNAQLMAATGSEATAPIQAFVQAAPASPIAEGSLSRFGSGSSLTNPVRLAEDESDFRLRKSRTGYNTEAYDFIQENVFLPAKENPLSTFSIDVDTASYANVRRFLQNDDMPPAGAIRTEELINYFTYDYPQPKGEAPFSVNLEVSRAPWDTKRELIRIGLKGRELPAAERGPANLVFLIDVSGSMDQPDKLPLLQRSLQSLVENLSPKDRVAIVVYAGSSGLVLPSTPGKEKPRILEAIENLRAGGSTNGGEGIRLAYETARENFLKEGGNRVILCTDGDFNVGTTNQSELVRLIEKERASGVFLSVLGFGTGNLKDSTMEKLADKGNGNYSYIDSPSEGRRVLVEQMGATLFTIAKDVKIQVEFNPARVAGYRLIGYENRLLAKEDFNDDKKDAGEIGAGHSVTALYEIIPAGEQLPDHPSVDPLKYQTAAAENPESQIPNPKSEELLTIKLRYKAPDGDKSKLLEFALGAPEIPPFDQASTDFRFATAVAAFGMKLRGSPTTGDIGWNDIKKIARGALGEDPGSSRAEFLTLIEKASHLSPSGRATEE